jgi:hypothetical protein
VGNPAVWRHDHQDWGNKAMLKLAINGFVFGFVFNAVLIMPIG